MAIILADGDFPSHPIPLQALSEAHSIYCCDGAIRKLLTWIEAGNEPQCHEIYVIGDGDSISQNEWDNVQDRMQQKGYTVHRNCESEQDYNDLTKTSRFAFSRGERELIYLGATGLREDHTIGNISLMCYYSSGHAFNGEKPQMVRMISDYGTFTPIHKTTSFQSFARQQVSIFSMRYDTRYSTEGLQYPIHNQSFNQWWETTLNAALGDDFKIIIPEETYAELIVFQTHEPKDAR